MVYISSLNIKDTDRIQFIEDYYGLSNALDKAKENIEQRKKNIFGK